MGTKYASTETSPEPVTLAQLREGIQTEAGGMVFVEGEGIEPGTRIGFGVAQILAKIPNEGVSEEKIRAGDEWHLDWIKEELIPAGLVEKRDGLYYRTPEADGAKYSLKRYEPSQRRRPSRHF